MQSSVEALLRLGKIPPDDEMSDALFRQYDSLLQSAEAVTCSEAQALTALFSDDCDDLNWGLLHLIETAFAADPDGYRRMLADCANDEYRKLLMQRLENRAEQTEG